MKASSFESSNLQYEDIKISYQLKPVAKFFTSLIIRLVDASTINELAVFVCPIEVWKNETELLHITREILKAIGREEAIKWA